MVSFKQIIVVGLSTAAVVSAIPAPAPAANSISLNERNAAPVPPPEMLPADSTFTDAEKRQNRGRMTLQWAPQGRLIFLLGWQLPNSILDSFESLGPNGPARALFENFHQWFSDNQSIYQRAWLLFQGAANRGGVYDQANTSNFGFGINMRDFPTADDMQGMLDAITAWAQQAGGVVQVTLRPNGFYDPAAIGAGGRKRDLEDRARTDQCVPLNDFWQYATVDAADVDINRDIRWGGECA